MATLVAELRRIVDPVPIGIYRDAEGVERYVIGSCPAQGRVFYIGRPIGWSGSPSSGKSDCQMDGMIAEFVARGGDRVGDLDSACLGAALGMIPSLEKMYWPGVISGEAKNALGIIPEKGEG